MKKITLSFDEYLDPNIHNYDFHWQSTDYPILHNHDFWEFTTVTDGTVLHEFNGKTYKLTQGDSFLIKPIKDTHRLVSVTPNSARICNLSIRDDAVRKISECISGDLYEKMSNLPEISFALSGASYNKLIEYASAVRTAVVTNKNRESISNLFFIFILEIISSQLFLEKSTYPDWLVDILKRINDPKNLDIFAKDIVKSSTYSHNYILRNFNKYLGTNLVSYINSIKMNNALDLLLNTDMSILEISSTLGFDSLSHFNHLFKRTYGISPKEYKNKHVSPENDHKKSSKKRTFKV